MLVPPAPPEAAGCGGRRKRGRQAAQPMTLDTYLGGLGARPSRLSETVAGADAGALAAVPLLEALLGLRPAGRSSVAAALAHLAPGQSVIKCQYSSEHAQ